MYQSTLVKVAALIAGLTAVSASTIPFEARQDSQEYGGQLDWSASTCKGPDGHQAYLTFAFCQKCNLNTGGSNQCSQVPMISSADEPGKFGQSAATRYVQINTNFDPCKSTGENSFSTPMGFGKYIANGKCQEAGAIAGEIVLDGGYVMQCQAFNSGDSNNGFNINVGVVQYGCGVMLQCTGLQNPTTCP